MENIHDYSNYYRAQTIVAIEAYLKDYITKLVDEYGPIEAGLMLPAEVIVLHSQLERLKREQREAAFKSKDGETNRAFMKKIFSNLQKTES